MKHTKTFLHLKKGMGLIEIILALALFSVFILAIFRNQWATHDLAITKAREVVALNNAQNSLLSALAEEVHPAWLHDIANVFEEGMRGPFGTKNFLYKKPYTLCKSQVVSDTVWQSGWGKQSTSSQSVLNFETDISDKLGGDCGGQTEIFSDSGFINDGSIDFGIQTTSVDVQNGFVYISLSPGDQSDSDLAIVPLQEPRHSIFLNIGAAINKIDAAHNYVFAAVNNSTTQVAAVNVENPLAPVLVATTTLPGIAGGSRPEGVSIAYFDSKIYVGTKRTAGNEFHILDVTNPGSPVWLGSKEVNHNINDIAIRDGFAFLATSGNVSDLIVFDVRNPAHITQVAGLDLPGNEDSRSIFVIGNEIFLGRYKSMSSGHFELYRLAYSLDQSGNFLGLQTLDSQITGADTNSLYVANNTIFAATKNQNSELQIFEPNSAGHISQAAMRDLPFPATGIDSENDEIVVTAGTDIYFFKQSHE